MGNIGETINVLLMMLATLQFEYRNVVENQPGLIQV